MSLALASTSIIHISVMTAINFVFLLVVIFSAVASAIMLFHWKKYGMGGKTLAFTEIVYFVVVVLLIFAAFLSLN